MTEGTGNRDGLNTAVGTKDFITLKPEKVKIIRVERVTVGKEKKAEKLVCFCKHPAKEELIELSNMKYIDGEKISVSGLWVNLDEDKNIRKGSALAQFMNFLGVKTLLEIEGKECDTILDGKYLVLKAYS